MSESKSIQKDIEKLNKKGMRVATTLYAEQTILWIKELSKIKSLNSYITLSPLSLSLKKLYSKHFLLSYLSGYFKIKNEIEEESESFSVDIKKELHSYDKAIQILKAKKMMNAEEYNLLLGNIKKDVFFVTGIERQNAIIAVRDFMIEIIEAGGTVAEFKEGLPEIFESFGITPLSTHHVENVFRTNTQSLYNIARYEAVINYKNVEGLQYVAIEDSRTRADHLQWNGRQFAKTDSIWNSLYPPLDYQCRCSVIAVTLGKIERENIKLKAGTKVEIEKAKKTAPEFNNAKDMKQYGKRLDKLKQEKERKAEELNKKQKEILNEKNK